MENVKEIRTWGPLMERDGGLYPDPDNKALTVEELREMDGEPVYITGLNVWVLVSMDTGVPVFVFRDSGRVTAADCFDVDYAAYRHPPDKGE